MGEFYVDCVVGAEKGSVFVYHGMPQSSVDCHECLAVKQFVAEIAHECRKIPFVGVLDFFEYLVIVFCPGIVLEIYLYAV